MKSSIHSFVLKLIGQEAIPIMVFDRHGIPLFSCLASLSLSKECLTLDPAIPSISLYWNHESVGKIYSTHPSLILVGEFLNHSLEAEFLLKTLAQDSLEKYKEINFLYDFSEKLSTCLSVKDITQMILKEVVTQIHFDQASVMLVNEVHTALEVVNGMGGLSQSSTHLPINQGIAGAVFSTGRAEIVNEVSKDSRYIGSLDSDKSLLCVPLQTKSQAIGVINISNRSGVHYTAQDLKFFSSLAIQAASAIENAQLHEQKIRQMQIKNNLGRYLSPHILDSILDSNEEITLGTTKKNITMLFSDIRGFSSSCERLDPETIVSHLNEYFELMVGEIFHQKGTVNKFVGDMIVAMFGAPAEVELHELYAVRAAIAMQRSLTQKASAWIREHFGTGIGISTGEMIVGNIGSSQHMDYTAIGDEVNIAARLQGLAQGGQILTTRKIFDILNPIENKGFDLQHYGDLQVKGKENSVEIFEVLYH